MRQFLFGDKKEDTLTAKDAACAESKTLLQLQKKDKSAKNMSKPQIALNIPIVTTWSIRRPVVYRYINKAYVDKFFEDGSLRLSSFAAFARHQDEQRLDKNEGSSFFVNNDPIGGTGTWAQIFQGMNAYVLCGSIRFTHELKKVFKSESGFRINDPTAFGCEIARVLPGCFAGREGPCMYLNYKLVLRDVDATKMLEAFKNPDQTERSDHLKEVFNMAGDDGLFLKEKRYELQAEYRLIWAVDKTFDFILSK